MDVMAAALTVGEVMTRTVHVASPRTAVAVLARTMLENGVGALPVVDGGRVVGIVSKRDLLSDRRGYSAADVMTSPVLVIPPETPAREAARELHRRGFRHLPIVDAAGRLQGIVSRGDLLRVYLRTDAELRRRISADLKAAGRQSGSSHVEVEVEAGLVTLKGRVERHSEAVELASRVGAIEGVGVVDSRLRYSLDDLAAALR